MFIPVAPGASMPESGMPARGPALFLTMFGSFTATVNGVPLRFSTRKASAVLAYCALGEAAGEPRDRLIGLLWSLSKSDKNAQDSVRQAVMDVNHTLRDAGFTGFDPGKQILSIDRSLLHTDVDSVLSVTRAGGAHPRLLSTVRLADTLLSDLESVDEQFQAWVRMKRHTLHEQLTSTLQRALPQGAFDDASIELGQALANLDPSNEIACRHLIRAHVARGEIGAALKAYKVLWDELEREFEAEPSPETQELIVSIKQQSSWSTRPGEMVLDEMPVAPLALPPPPPPAPPRRLFIVVNEFNVEGVPERQRRLVNGFRHEFLATLASFREWSVRRQKAPGPAAANGAASDTEYTLHATVYGQSSDFRVVVTLEDETSQVVWSQPITLRTSELLAARQRIVQRLAASMNVTLSADRLRRATARQALEGDLHEMWLEGQLALASWSPDGLIRAEALFTGLLDEGVQFSPALSSLVQVRNSKHIVFPGVFRSLRAHEESIALAQRAVRLDPVDSRAQLCLAWSNLLANRPAQATLSAANAIELNPNDAWTMLSSAHIFGYCGDVDRARDLMSSSTAIVPLATPAQKTYAAIVHFLEGRYDRCLDMALGGVDASPGFALWAIASLAHTGRVSEARALLDRSLGVIATKWQGAGSPERRAMCRWLVHMFPVSVPGTWERLRAGVELAGGDVDGVTFGDWQTY